jgi:hypothetical protein
VALREEEESQRMSQGATVSREEERIPSLLHTKTSGRRREAFAIRFQAAATPREEERVPPLLTTKDLREEEEVFRILIRRGDIQGGGADVAASSQMTQGGGEGHLIPKLLLRAVGVLVGDRADLRTVQAHIGQNAVRQDRQIIDGIAEHPVLGVAL